MNRYPWVVVAIALGVAVCRANGTSLRGSVSVSAAALCIDVLQRSLSWCGFQRDRLVVRLNCGWAPVTHVALGISSVAYRAGAIEEPVGIGGQHIAGVSTIWIDCAATWPRHAAASDDCLARVGVFALAVPSAQDDCRRGGKRSS